MGKLDVDAIVDEILHVQKKYGPEMRIAAKALGRVYGKNILHYLKQHLSNKGIPFGITKNKSLNHVPSGHDSFHLDENDEHVHYSHS